MTNQQHPITPPDELVMKWVSLANEYDGRESWIYFATQAARWGDDQRLLAVIDWIRCPGQWPHGVRGELSESTLDRLAHELYTAMRPKPLSETDQALAVMQKLSTSGYPCDMQQSEDWDTIRRALERLKQLEAQS